MEQAPVKAIHVPIVARPDHDGLPGTSSLEAMLSAIDAYDVDRLSTGDVQGYSLEQYLGLGYFAALARRPAVGAFVTTAATRDPGLHAASLASLDAVTGGRAFMVLGRGDGVVKNLGLRPHTIRETREALLAIRALLTDREARIGDRHVRLPWPDAPGPRVPLYLVAGGPKMMRVAGEVADGAYVATGVTPDNIARAHAWLDAGADAAGRARPDVWWVTRFAIGDTYEEAVATIAESLTSMGNHSLRGADFAERGVPPELWEPLAEYHRRYDWARKNPLPGSGYDNVDLMNELGLTEYFLERFAIVGTPDQVVERMRTLAARGVDQITCLVDSPRELELLGELIPRAKAPVGA
ncbi:MAG TPA: LLM class flavin-dependent oxidoreductase [Baekduia sp.]|uniref:LLM class flavin-dependent oxidoreductase n=1 Tax=Baekduia sp. TaxID=2600305 RepID=UPI002D78005E|nr:LLM class flavin-dependent oxidoreductase [Baekduia sp.]HET6508991.1 LLM class flavin-dependent oxidoreductase [Baekduia sp.]